MPSGAALAPRTPSVIHRYRELLSNAGSLLGTTMVTSLLGLAYWWLAARMFPPVSVGFGAAGVSAMTLLATVGMLGFGTLLIGELGDGRPGGRLVVTSLAMTGFVSGVLGLAFVMVTPFVASDGIPYASGPLGLGLFVCGVTLTAVSFVLDQALIGILRGGLQLWRNLVFAISKLLLVAVAGLYLVDQTGLIIVASWSAGTLLSLIFLLSLLTRQGTNLVHRPDWALLRGFRRDIVAHNWLNLGFQAPRLTLPLVVTGVLSAEINAAFFAAWMIATILYLFPTHLSTILFSVGAKGSAAELEEKLAFTMKLSLAVGVVAVPILMFLADPLLALFGPSYAIEAAVPLQIMAVAYFPIVVKVHFIAVGRVLNRIPGAARLIGIGAAFEIGGGAVGAHVGGLTGLSIGFLAAVTIEAIITAGPVVRAAGGVGALMRAPLR